MERRSQKARKKVAKTQELIAVAFAKNPRQAEEYRILLENNDIPAVIKDEPESEMRQGFAILVPEEYIDHAHLVLENEDLGDDFRGFEFDIDDNDDLDLKYDMQDDDDY